MAYNKLDFDFPSNNPIADSKSANLVWLQWFQRIQSIVGVRQVWTNVFASRSLGVTYVNDTGRPIKVNVRVTITVAGSIVATFGNGVSVISQHQATIGAPASIYFEVSNGDSYTLSVSAGVGTSVNWVELK